LVNEEDGVTWCILGGNGVVVDVIGVQWCPQWWQGCVGDDFVLPNNIIDAVVVIVCQRSF
jgi:hypothetical protein